MRRIFARLAVGLAMACPAASLMSAGFGPAKAVEFAEELGRSWRGDFDGMAERRLIRALVVPSKTFFFVDQSGTQRGATAELFQAFEDFVNRQLKTKTLRVAVRFIPVRRDQLLPFLAEGRGDIAAANLTITPGRLEDVDFADPLGVGVRELVVTGPAGPALKSLDDLAGREVYVRPSSSYHESLVLLNQKLTAAGRTPVKLLEADEYLEDEDILEMLQAGLVGTTVVDSHKAAFWQEIFPEIVVHDDLALREGGEIAWAIRKGSPQLREVIDRFIKDHKKGTLLGNILFTRYLKDNQWVRNAASEGELDKLRKVAELFRKYGERYAFDWLMVAAQAYQESGLDHGKQSPVGAVGIMQVLPSTAADPNVGIPDIQPLENNIHAGVKYLRFLRTNYFSDVGIDPVNQGLLSFAAYNAGPARVTSLRAKAAKLGLDPNVWFQNVEVMAAKEIGRETVQYVSNIYKYYIAYRLYADVLIQRREAKEVPVPAE